MICDLHFKDDQFNNSKKTKTIRPSIKIFCVAGAIINKVTSIAVSPPSLDVSQPEISGSFESPCSPSSSVSSPRPQSNISSPETSPSSTTDNKKRIRQLQQKLRRPRVKVQPERIMESLNEVMNDAYRTSSINGQRRFTGLIWK
ncbi:hypothetical protein Fcan01_10171 [Folsomia candida]|uniref:Uncharacterized protein n=1 Tax=Folsomia candida TaxID=158441 RepID=A0A226EB02_FOLCA|nr:hypothetical protein Fcan01_10171 [Folsomia candida]